MSNKFYAGRMRLSEEQSTHLVQQGSESLKKRPIVRGRKTQMSSEGEFEKGKVFASLPKTTRGMPVVLGQSPKGDQLTYTNSNSVYIVNLQDVTNVDIYTEHSHPATVAKISPSGFYCASGDNAGNVRIWDTTQTTHILKGTYAVFSGPVRDIAWNDDSKRIAAVGEGRERFGHVFLFDTGTSNGNLSGQSRPVSSIDFKPSRPYRLVSGSEDNTVALFEGPPFKFKTTFHEHSRFVHVTRYSPDGTLFASAGADGKVVLFDGAEGTKEGELVDDSCKGAAHSGSVFGLCWSPCGQKIATASGDKTVKIWNVAGRSLEKSITLGGTVDDQQLSVIWTKTAGVISVSLSGFLNFINGELGQVEKVVQGHNKPITALTISSDRKFIFTADFEGHITRWDVGNGDSKRVSPSIHKSQVIGLQVTDKGNLVSAGWDDTLQFTPGVSGSVENVRANSTKLSSQPWGVASNADGSLVVAACYKNIAVFKGEKLVSDQAISYPGTAVALLDGKGLVAVGGQDSKVHIYSLDGTSLAEKKTLSHAGHITAVAFSPDGKHLVATDSARKVVPYSVENDFAPVAEKEWTFHTAKVNCVAWNPNGRHVATGGLDTNIIVWDLQRSGEHPIIIKGAHAMSPVNGLVWLNETELISAGQDANIKFWKVKV